MIFRVITGLLAIVLVATVRGLRRRARRDKSTMPAMTVRNGYTGLENPLYRVVIERGGPADGATFTWSRDDERDAVRPASAVQRGVWIQLGDGVGVRFDGDAPFSPGDFWTFPARSAADTVTMKARRKGAPSARGHAKRRR